MKFTERFNIIAAIGCMLIISVVAAIGFGGLYTPGTQEYITITGIARVVNLVISLAVGRFLSKEVRGKKK